MKVLATLLLFTGLALAADVSGKWTGTFSATGDQGKEDGTAVLLLKQNGSEITGSVGPTVDEQHTISKGKIEGDKITLESNDGGMVLKLDLVLAGERISGNVTANGEGRSMKATIDVKRAQ